MAKTRHQHAWSKTDPGGALGSATELNPDVGVKCRGVVKPSAGVSKVFSNPCVLVTLSRRRKTTRKFHGHNPISMLQTDRIGLALLLAWIILDFYSLCKIEERTRSNGI